MEWGNEKPNRGDTRIKRVFLMLPKSIKGKTKWLQYALIHQIYDQYEGFGEWYDSDWVNT